MKEFFKPTIAKIIILLIAPFFLSVELGVAKVGTTATNLELTYNIFVTLLPYIVVMFSAFYFISTNPIDSSTWQWADLSFWQRAWGVFLEMIIPLFINYLLACLLVFLYKKVKGTGKPAAQTAPPEK